MKTKREIWKRCLEGDQKQKVSINSRLKAIWIIGQRKAFCWQRISKCKPKSYHWSLLYPLQDVQKEVSDMKRLNKNRIEIQ